MDSDENSSLSWRQQELIREYKQKVSEYEDLQITPGVPIYAVFECEKEVNELKRKISMPPLSYMVCNGDGLFWEGLYRLTEYVYDAFEQRQNMNFSRTYNKKNEQEFWGTDEKLRLVIKESKNEEDKILREIEYHQWRMSALAQREEINKFTHGVQKIVDNNLLYHVMHVLLSHADFSYIDLCKEQGHLLRPTQLDDIIYSEFMTNDYKDYISASDRDGVCWVVNEPDGKKFYDFWKRPNIINPKAYSHMTTTQILQDVILPCRDVPFREMMLYYAMEFAKITAIEQKRIAHQFIKEYTFELPNLTDEQCTIIEHNLIQEIFRQADVHRYAVFVLDDESIVPYSQFRVLTGWVGKPLHDAGLRCNLYSMETIAHMREGVKKNNERGPWGIPPPYKEQ